MLTKKLPRLLLVFLFFLLLYLSWLIPPTKHLWSLIDTKGYLFFNSWILHSDFSRTFWAIMNHKLMDWVFDVVMLFFVLRFIFFSKNNYRLRTLQILTFIIFCSLVILTVNRYLLTEVLHLRRLSPSLTVDGGVRLSSFIHTIKIKETHHACFPGDHGTTAFLFSLIIFYLMPVRYGIGALLLSLFFCLPRIIVGAHWITDVIIGSFSVAYLSLSLFIDTGFFDLITKKLLAKAKKDRHESTL